MKLVVDENIPFAKTVFSKLGEVRLLPGRAIGPETVRDAVALVVRSVTKVDEALLKNSTVQFVGTATAGVDHIDTDYLKAQHIFFASAAGANADSVAEYVIRALFIVTRRKGMKLAGKRLSIIGAGHIGKRVDDMARAVGMETVLNDPPLQRESGDPVYRPFREALDADFISLHVPLNLNDTDKTRHLINADVLSVLSPGTVVINTSRGEVVDGKAFLRGLADKKLSPPIFDVWEQEPDIHWNLLKAVALGTPHIAGYALDGKVKGTLMIYETLCAALGVMPSTQLHAALLPDTPPLSLDAAGKTDEEALAYLTCLAYDLEADDRRLKKLLALPESRRPAAFDHLRKTYPIRRGFRSRRVSLQNGTMSLLGKIKGLGFRLQP
ncbi:MAG: 4-phosphoerythronate dehydrogenase [Nitrospiria bacterium]